MIYNVDSLRHWQSGGSDVSNIAHRWNSLAVNYILLISGMSRISW